MEDTDLLLVERAGTSYKIETQDMSNLQDSDLLLVEREGVSYKMTADQLPSGGGGVIGSIEQPVSVLTPLNGAGLNEGQTYQPLSTAITAVGAGGTSVYATDTIASVVAGVPEDWASKVTGSVWTQFAPKEVLFTNAFDTTPATDTCVWAIRTPGIAGQLTFSPNKKATVIQIKGYRGKNVNMPDEAFMINDVSYINKLPNGNGNFNITIDLGTSTLIESIKWHNYDATTHVALFAIKFDDVQLLSTDVSDTILTFPTSNNFDKFEVGDVVQAEQVVGDYLSGVVPGGSYYGADYGWDKALNGSVSSKSPFLQTIGNAEIRFSPALTNAPGIYAGYAGGSSTGSGLILSVDTNGDGTYDLALGESLPGGANVLMPDGTYGYAKTSVPAIYGIQVSYASGGNYIAVNAIENGGKLLVDSSLSASEIAADPTKASITAIDAAGPTITVDGGSWYGADGTGDAGDGRYEPSQEWSSAPIFNSNGYAVSAGYGLPPAAFNGVVPVVTGDTCLPVSGGTWSFDFGDRFADAQVLTLYRRSRGGNSFKVNGVFYELAASDSIIQETINLTDGLQTLDFLYSGGNVYCSFAYIEIDGATLIDSSIPGAGGATDLTKTVSSQATLTFTDDTELANMVGPLSQVDENGNVKTPVTSEIANVSNQLFNQIVSCDATTDAQNALDGDWSTSAYSGTTVTATLSNCVIPPNHSWWQYLGQSSDEGNNAILQTSIGEKTYRVFGYGSNQFLIWRNDLDYDVTVTSVACNREAGGPSYLTAFAIVPDSASLGTTPGSIASISELQPYTLMSSSVSYPESTLTFESPNPDLQYFQPGDNVGTESGFAPVLYTGAPTSQSITGVGFSPDLVWIKDRQAEWNHKLFDTVRGATKSLESNTTASEASETDGLTSFDSDGFTLGTGSPVNSDSYGPYVAWCWDAGDTTVTNNDGTIESQVRSNGNFSVVTYSSANNAVVGHGLNSAAKFVIVKSTDSTSNWEVYHESLGVNSSIVLNANAPSSVVTSNWGSVSDWTDSTFGVYPTAYSVVDNNYGSLVAYCWAETPGVSSFGEYDGNSSSQGVTVDCGFKPAFVMVKASTSTGNWNMFSYPVSTDDITTGRLWANTSGAENSDNDKLEFLDNGFRVLNAGVDINGSGITYVYAAFAGSNPIEVVDVDVVGNTMTVDNSGYKVGDTVTGQPLIASADDVEYQDGNVLGVSNVSGTWLAGLHAQGAEVTSYAPSPESIVFTSMNGGTTPFTGTDATLTSRTWTLEKGNSSTGPWTEVGVYVDTAANASQDGATPWANPTLEANKFYQVKVEYSSNNAASVVSTFNTFKTGDA